MECDCMMEGEVYAILNWDLVRNIPQRVDFCDVGDALFHQTRQVQRFARAVWLLEDFRPSISLLRHHRLVLDTVGERLENFQSALIGM